MDTTYKLCYIKEPWAWFTTADLKHQWGDDWNDKPYEHNAGDPYSWRPYMVCPEYQLYVAAFAAPDYRPIGYACLNSPYSVEQINAGEAPWLLSPYRDLPEIPAGISYPDFVARIHESGGTIFESIQQSKPAETF